MGEKGTYGYEAMQRGLLGRRVPAGVAGQLLGGWEEPDGDRSFNPQTGQNAHWDDEKQQWMDSKTGTPVSRSGLEKD